MKVLFKLFLSITILLLINSCKCHTKLDPNKEFTFLSRAIGGASRAGYSRNIYMDNVVLDKQAASKMTMKHYVTIAKHYIDTVKASLPVSSITFCAITSCITPIDSFSDERDYAILSLNFSNEIESNNPENIILVGITVWKDGKVYKNYDRQSVDTTLFNSLKNSDLPMSQFIK